MDKKLQKRLEDLVGEINKGLGPKSGRPLKLTKKDAKPNPKRIELRDLAGSLEDLRIGIKYLLFDLEATRRENFYLKSKVKDLF